jgi:hypothetical protein
MNFGTSLWLNIILKGFGAKTSNIVETAAHLLEAKGYY